MSSGFKSQFIMGVLLVLPDLPSFRIFEITKRSDSDATWRWRSLYVTDMPAVVCYETCSGGSERYRVQKCVLQVEFCPSLICVYGQLHVFIYCVQYRPIHCVQCMYTQQNIYMLLLVILNTQNKLSP
jgi:hypothetical protein